MSEWASKKSGDELSVLASVTLFAGAVSANDDETDQGDYAYSKKLVLQPAQ